MRSGQNAEGFRKAFREIGERQPGKAAGHLNEERLSFPALFLLMPEIRPLNLYPSLNERNRTALKLCARVWKDKELSALAGPLSLENSGIIRLAAKWILETGWREDGLHDDFDGALDAAAALLIRTYDDRSVLPVVTKLVFERNRKGRLIHDLVWCLFKARDPEALRLVANYLGSADSKDTELARKLLHFTPNGEAAARGAGNLHRSYLSWLGENSPYLYFTGESLQATSDPEPVGVDLNAKYLGKRISPRNRKPLTPFSENDYDRLKRLTGREQEEKTLLADYSRRLHDRSVRLWEQWIGYPVDVQLRMARKDLGGRR